MNSALDKYLNEARFNHIEDVIGAFNLCMNLDEVMKVIGEIPHKFGSFTVELSDESGRLYLPEEIAPDDEEFAKTIDGFSITNDYTDSNQDWAEDKWDFDWYEG